MVARVGSPDDDNEEPSATGETRVPLGTFKRDNATANAAINSRRRRRVEGSDGTSRGNEGSGLNPRQSLARERTPARGFEPQSTGPQPVSLSKLADAGARVASRRRYNSYRPRDCADSLGLQSSGEKSPRSGRSRRPRATARGPGST